jgi:uncharacterized membrane protein YoaK (UPF0700 family)
VSDLILAVVLAFVAGAINAGGFLAIGQYTSHMTGYLSIMADHIALGSLTVAAIAFLAIMSFIAGAATSAILINWARGHSRQLQYAHPIALEGVLLLALGLLGALSKPTPLFLTLAAPLLCYVMGLQNAIITKLSGSRLRTTHVTGMMTDIGIEMGKMLYWNRGTLTASHQRVVANMNKLRLLLQIVGAFFIGGVIGALGFGIIGYSFCVPLALILFLFSLPQLVYRYNQP